jgi:hypothetical protein
MVMFVISGVNDKFWNQFEFIKYLVANQHKVIDLDIVSEAIDLENLGVYKLLDLFKFEQVIINTWNPLEKHSQYKINFRGPTFFFTKNESNGLKYVVDIDPKLHCWNQEKIFMCLYGRPNAGRLALAGELNKKYSKQSIIHFSYDTSDNALIQFEFDKLLSYDINSVMPAANLLGSLPILQSSRDRHTKFDGYDYSDPLTALYKNTLIDVVGETHVMGRTFFPTEKTTRPILLKKPFITFASRNHMAYLRQMGFQTFHGFWDEDYDGFETKDRLLRMYQVINNLASLPIDQLADIYQKMQPILDHNYNLLINQTYSTIITEIF